MRPSIYAFGISLLAACSTSSGDGDDATSSGQHPLAFHGEQEAFPGFSYDTGAQPAASPVQLQLTFSAAGKLTADAAATVGGHGDALAVAATPGSGKFAIDAHVKAAATLHVHITGVPSYDGPIPGIENFDIALANQATFDPFLLGGTTARLAVNLPRTELPPIPLGSVPGKLVITVSNASTVQSELSGVCAGLDQQKIQYLAQTSTSATIVLEPKIVITVPVIGDKEFPIPAVTITVPALQAPLDLGTLDAPEGGDVPASASMAVRASCAGATCKAPSSVSLTPAFVPSIAPANQCNSSQIYAFVSACGTTTSTHDTCHAFLSDAANRGCSSCLATPASAHTWGAFVDGYPNIGGCIARLDPAQMAIALDYQAVAQCEAAACTAACTGATAEQLEACLTDVDGGACASYASKAYNEYPTGAAAACVDVTSQEDAFRVYANLFCGTGAN